MNPVTNPINNNNNEANKTSAAAATNDSTGHAQDHSHSDSIMLVDDFSFNSSVPSTIAHDLRHEHQMSFLSTEEETFPIADNDNDDEEDASRNEEQEQQTSILSPEWLLPPIQASTPVLSIVSTTNASNDQSERDIENELFQNIEDLVREFLQRSNRQYPYYRVMRWTIDNEPQQQPRLEYVVTVVINRPTIIFD